MRCVLVHVSRLMLAAALVGACVEGAGSNGGRSLVVSTPSGEVVEMPADDPFVWCGDFSEGSVEISKPAVHVYMWPRLDPALTDFSNGWIIRTALSDIRPGQPIRFPTKMGASGSGGVDEPLGADVYVLAMPDEFSSRVASSSGSITFDAVPCAEGESLVEFSVDAVVGSEDASDRSVLLQGSFSGPLNEPPQRDIYRQDCLLPNGCASSSVLKYEGPPVGPEASVIRPDVDCGAPGFYEASRTAPETVVITASWVGQCDASHTVELTIGGAGNEATSAEVEYKSSANGEPQMFTRESPEVRVDQFSLDGLISGSWGQQQFWAMVDRPTRVELSDTGSARLELGQAVWTGPPSCLIHNDGSLDASSAPVGVLHRDCDDSSLRQVGFEGTAVLVSTEGG